MYFQRFAWIILFCGFPIGSGMRIVVCGGLLLLLYMSGILNQVAGKPCFAKARASPRTPYKSKSGDPSTFYKIIYTSKLILYFINVETSNLGVSHTYY